MSIQSPYVTVDWGTTQMRAYLCTVDGNAADRIEGPGIGQLSETPAATLFTAVSRWVEEYGTMDLLLGGMVGSNIGWRAAPYVECPLRPADLARHLVSFEERGHRVMIVPGVSCINSLGQPDVMRGEEIQLLGWLADGSAGGSELVCLPGTHAKWARVRDGVIESFTTSLTGEMFALLRRNSVLVADCDRATQTQDDTEFVNGVRVAARHGDRLMHLVFSTRSRALLEPESTGDSSSYLSGMLIGADVNAAMMPNEAAEQVVQLIGTPQLCERYALALETLGFESRVHQGDDMVIAGFMTLAELAP